LLVNAHISAEKAAHLACGSGHTDESIAACAAKKIAIMMTADNEAAAVRFASGTLQQRRTKRDLVFRLHAEKEVLSKSIRFETPVLRKRDRATLLDDDSSGENSPTARAVNIDSSSGDSSIDANSPAFKKFKKGGEGSSLAARRAAPKTFSSKCHSSS
jgi:hypothetical protein